MTNDTIEAGPVGITLNLAPAGTFTITLDNTAADDPDLTGHDLQLWFQAWTTPTPDLANKLGTVTRNDDDAATGLIHFTFDAAALYAVVGRATVRGLVMDGELPVGSIITSLRLDGTNEQSATTTIPLTSGSVVLPITFSTVATGGSGVTDHGNLDGLTDADGHPIGAITGLQAALDDRVTDDDSRLTDNRTPTAHASTHATAGSDPITPAAIGAQPSSEKDQAGGYAGLDGSGKLATSALPALAIGETFPVADQIEMLALTAQQGDIAVRADLVSTFILSGTDPSVLGDWTLLATPTDAVLSVNGQTGVVVLNASDVGAATSAQGGKADSAVQPADLADVATSGAYADVSGTPSLATVATSGDHADLSNKPTLGDSASLDVGTGSGDVAGGNAPFTVTANTQTDDYTLVLADAGKVIEMNKGTACTLTVPTNASVAFPVGTIIEVYGMGAGAVTVEGDGGVTVQNTADLAAQYATASLRKRATDEWVLTGSLA